MASHGLSIQRACSAIKLSRSSYYGLRRGRLEGDREIIGALQQLVSIHRRWGFWKCYHRIRLDGKIWNHKRVYRIYCALGLNQVRRTKKRLLRRERQPMEVLREMNHTWAIDFMSDALYDGRRFRTFNVMDEGMREALGIEIDTSLPAIRIIRVLDQIIEWRGSPKAIRCDNGPEMQAQVFLDWCRDQGIELKYIQPGEPNQNPFIERFNRTYRNEVLDAYLFEDLDQVREITQEWLGLYNEQRPHDALGGLPPSLYRQSLKTKISTLELSA